MLLYADAVVVVADEVVVVNVAHTIRIDFDIAHAAAAACCRMTGESAELALLSARTSGFQSQMTVVEPHDEVGDGHCMSSLRATYNCLKGASMGARGEVPLVVVILNKDD